MSVLNQVVQQRQLASFVAVSHPTASQRVQCSCNVLSAASAVAFAFDVQSATGRQRQQPFRWQPHSESHRSASWSAAACVAVSSSVLIDVSLAIVSVIAGSFVVVYIQLNRLRAVRSSLLASAVAFASMSVSSVSVTLAVSLSGYIQTESQRCMLSLQRLVSSVAVASF